MTSLLIAVFVLIFLFSSFDCQVDACPEMHVLKPVFVKDQNVLCGGGNVSLIIYYSETMKHFILQGRKREYSVTQSNGAL